MKMSSDKKMEFKGTIYLGESMTDQSLWSLLPDDLKSFYQDINGLVTFQGGLHIRGCVSEPDWHSLRKVWKGDWALHRSFSNLRETDIPFAQDCLGDQFFIRMGSVWRLVIDTGDIEDLEVELYDFFEDAVNDPVDYLDLEPLVYFLEEGNSLGAGQVLQVDPPFTEESDHYEITAISMESLISAFHDAPL
ncbi:MAG: hypothetical protein IPL46_32300 [Saprospiraceae bacterium]|nr:hypothetical protein [Saprospiraceae bacterium]